MEFIVYHIILMIAKDSLTEKAKKKTTKKKQKKNQNVYIKNTNNYLFKCLNLMFVNPYC